MRLKHRRWLVGGAMLVSLAAFALTGAGAGTGNAQSLAANSDWPVYGGDKAGQLLFDADADRSRQCASSCRLPGSSIPGRKRRVADQSAGRRSNGVSPPIRRRSMSLCSRCADLQAAVEVRRRRARPPVRIAASPIGAKATNAGCSRVQHGPFLYALDPATGQPIDSFGESTGRLIFVRALGAIPTGTPVSITPPGIVYRDR